MKALVMSRPGDVTLTDLPLPQPGPHQILMRINTAGICTNDIRDYQGDCDYSYPRIGGHEYCGTIAELGKDVDTTRFARGQRIVSYIIENCHTCELCKTGNENICLEHLSSPVFHNPDGISGYGGFAEYRVVDAEDVIVFHDEKNFHKLAFTEPLACCVNSINRVNVSFGQDVVVIGGGTMGLLHVQLLAKQGVRIIVSEPLAERRQKALDLGAHEVIDPVNEDALERLRSMTHGKGADIVFNTTAHPVIARQAVDMVAPCGTVVMFSSIHPRESIPVDVGAIHTFQKTITGAVSPTQQAYYTAAQLIDKGIIDPSPLIEAIYPSTDFDNAMACALRPDTYKVLVTFEDDAQ